jgi:hypothetical protein
MYALTQADLQLCQFLQDHNLIPPAQLDLALKVQKQSRGRLDMILWQLGLIDTQALTQFWEFRFPAKKIQRVC